MFDRLCLSFARQNPQLLRPEGVATVKRILGEPETAVVVISASIDNWVRPFFDGFGGKVQVLGTQIEVADGLLTGRFTSRNCYGQEKVNRLTALYPHRKDYRLTAFGDSRGDRELLAYADRGFYKPFRNGETECGK